MKNILKWLIYLLYGTLLYFLTYPLHWWETSFIGEISDQQFISLVCIVWLVFIFPRFAIDQIKRILKEIGE